MIPYQNTPARLMIPTTKLLLTEKHHQYLALHQARRNQRMKHGAFPTPVRHSLEQRLWLDLDVSSYLACEPEIIS